MGRLHWQRAVIKVGSALISPDGNGCSAEFTLSIARFITQAKKQGREVVLVSSGSVAAGSNKIKVQHLPTIAEKQAMAAIGQSQLMAHWARFFDFPCAQILLTYSDLKDRTRYVNVKNTISELLKHGALPVVNENDSVAVNEIKVGDNDNLAAYTALVAQADTLIICSDINGLYDVDPRKSDDAQLIPEVDIISPEIHALAGDAGTKMGTGGMRTKLQAAEKCSVSGIQTLIVNGRHSQVFDDLLNNENPGTWFKAQQSAETARRHWLRHTLPVTGEIRVDEGARKALCERGASLLPSGIQQVVGDFNAGEAVQLMANDHAFAKGIVLYSAEDMRQIAGMQSHEVASVLGYTSADVAIHRDDLIVYSGSKK